MFVENCLCTKFYQSSRLILHLQRHSIHLCSLNSKSNAQNERNYSRHRVVVTGIGIISPVGCNTELAWTNILNGFCGIKKLEDDAYKTLPCKIAAKITDSELNLNDHFSKSELRSIAPASAYALLAGERIEIRFI